MIKKNFGPRLFGFKSVTQEFIGHFVSVRRLFSYQRLDPKETGTLRQTHMAVKLEEK